MWFIFRIHQNNRFTIFLTWSLVENQIYIWKISSYRHLTTNFVLWQFSSGKLVERWISRKISNTCWHQTIKISSTRHLSLAVEITRRDRYHRATVPKFWFSTKLQINVFFVYCRIFKLWTRYPFQVSNFMLMYQSIFWTN